MSEIPIPESIQKDEKIQQEIIQKKDDPKVEVKEESPSIKSEENQSNWKKFREDRERERKARVEAEELAKRKNAEAEALKAAMDAILNKPQSQPQQNQYTDDEEPQEKIIERKIKEAIEKDRQAQRDEQQRIEAQTYPQRIMREHNDFNQVCTSENLDYLEYKHPEIARAFQHMPDGFDKWSSIYQAIKKLVPMTRKEDEARINKNMQKPQAHLPTMTDTQPQTSGWKLTEERRKANWERMQKDRKSIG